MNSKQAQKEIKAMERVAAHTKDPELKKAIEEKKKQLESNKPIQK